MRWALFATLLFAVSCADEDGTGADVGAVGERDGGGGSGDVPSSGGSGGAASSGGRAGYSTPVGSDCASTGCTEWNDTWFHSCCRDDGCGWTVNGVTGLQGLVEDCQPFQQPGSETGACSSVEVLRLAGGPPGQVVASYPGCCRPDGRCGSILHRYSGCVAREDINGTSETCVP